MYVYITKSENVICCLPDESVSMYTSALYTVCPTTMIPSSLYKRIFVLTNYITWV